MNIIHRTEYSILEYPFPEGEAGLITWEGRTVGLFSAWQIIIYERLPAEVLKPILLDIAEFYKDRKSLPPKYFGIGKRARREVVFAIGDRGYLKLIQLTVSALRGDVVSLNILKAMNEGDNEKDPEHEKFLMLVLGTLLGGEDKVKGERNQKATEDFLKLLK